MGDASYFLLRSAISRAEWRTPISALDDLQKRLIYRIADETAQGNAVRVSDLKALGDFGTRPTLLSRLNGMIESGLIARVPNPEDGRSHYLTLTPKAKRAIERVSRDVERAAPALRAASGESRRRNLQMPG
jgi:DNA-binding HxlR family transcriptional regulator